MARNRDVGDSHELAHFQFVLLFLDLRLLGVFFLLALAHFVVQLSDDFRQIGLQRYKFYVKKKR